MNNAVTEVQVRAVLPATSGYAVFIGNEEKTFVIWVDPSVGAAITMFMRGTPKERPLTHDLITCIFSGLGVKLDRVVINDLKNSTYFARIIISAENELGKKILELDARPSDSIALAVHYKCPIFVADKVFQEAKDESEALKRMNQESQEEEEE